MRATGLIPDAPELVAEDLAGARHVANLLGVSHDTLPPSVDHSSYVDHIADQGGTSSCVGQSLAASVYLRAKLVGSPIARVSAKAIYDVARLLAAPGRGLLDLGCSLSKAVLGCREYGLVAEDRWPLSDTNVNSPPAWDVWAHGLDAQLADYYRIPAKDAGTCDAIREALFRGHFPVFGMPVDFSYENFNGEGVYSPAGEVLGNHAQCLVAYDEAGVLVLNSWGESWGERGLAWVSWAFIRASAFDMIVPTVSPRKVA